jgi:hypothetical protein
MLEIEGDFNSMFADVSVPLRDIMQVISGSIRITCRRFSSQIQCVYLILRKTDASKLPEEFFQVVGIEICSPLLQVLEKYTLLRCSTNDPATA